MKRIDIISDTHGYLSDKLLAQLKGADLIVHAGDITSETDWEHLKTIAPIKGVMGNNDYRHDYGSEVARLCKFTYEGIRFAVAHYREDLPLRGIDIAVCGHTHRPRLDDGVPIIVNPGSASYPRGGHDPSMFRLFIDKRPGEGTASISSMRFVKL